MKLIEKCTKKEIELFKQAGIIITDKGYTNEELRIYERQITDYIMNHSSKNGDIAKLQNQYESIYRTISI